MWIFDGNKIAWLVIHCLYNEYFTDGFHRSLREIKDEVKVEVDLDKEDGREPRPGNADKNIHRIYIRLTTAVDFTSLTAWLARTSDFDNACFNAMSLLDHLLREQPSKNMIQLKKSFFSPTSQRMNLGKGVEAWKGVFASLRPVALKNGPGLSVTVDVANGTFWTPMSLIYAAQQLCGAPDPKRMGTALGEPGQKFRMMQSLKKLKRIGVDVSYRTPDKNVFERKFVVARVLESNAKQFKFQLRETDPDTGERIDKGPITLFDYFARVKGVVLQEPSLPVVEMTRKGNVFPMEFCRISADQRYVFKLDDKQTAEMIKHAVTPPVQRWAAIQQGVNLLNWQQDPYLQKYGLQISKAQTQVEARLLPAPTIKFGNRDEQPQPMRGKWDLKGKRFLRGNPKPLLAWGICILTSHLTRRPACDVPTAHHFGQEFMRIYKSHGGNVAGPPVVQMANMPRGADLITDIWAAVGQKFKKRPDLIFYFVPDKDSNLYQRLKKSSDIRYGFQSQVLQGAHVQKCQAQYISNVCMKVNAKLGGVTAEAKGVTNKVLPQEGTKRVMCIGADVSHAAPGADQPSMAAMTVSMNRACSRYAAMCQTNGHRLEIISTDNVNFLLDEMVTYWKDSIGGGKMPDEVFYFRDGVSEGQYRHVLDQEVRDIKAFFRKKDPSSKPKFSVIVASKRHHVRFFPPKDQGDRNGNPIPGTLVERGATHPFEFDFYLCSHAAIKGTARPIHYHVIQNETQVSPTDLQRMIYEHSYQYVRSTTAVSMFPAVYYAHLASNRAKAHEDVAPPTSSSKDKDKKGGGKDKGKGPAPSEAQGETKKGDGKEGTSTVQDVDAKKLLKLNENNGFRVSFWYI